MKRELSYTPSEDELDVTPGSTTSTTPPTSAPSTPSPGKKAKVAKPRAPKAPKEAGAKKKDLSAVNRTWTPELKVSFIEILLDRGKAASDMTELMNTVSLISRAAAMSDNSRRDYPKRSCRPHCRRATRPISALKFSRLSALLVPNRLKSTLRETKGLVVKPCIWPTVGWLLRNCMHIDIHLSISSERRYLITSCPVSAPPLRLVHGSWTDFHPSVDL